MEDKKYELNIDPRILELLGPNLYTNIYYVLAELIANAYDAEAHNVYIIQDGNNICVEDDGHGMSYISGDIDNYLNVARESRTNEHNSITPTLGRRRMGRKGVGKLAALSISENVEVMTIHDGEKSGFVLSRRPNAGNHLKPINDDNIHFLKVNGNGTSIVMLEPSYKLNKTADTIRRNLIKIFPFINEDFRLHVLVNNKEILIDSYDRGMARDLCCIITLGKEFVKIANKISNDYPDKPDRLVDIRNEKTFPLQLDNNFGEKKKYTLTIKGWIGAYKTTRGRKLQTTDFPDNFISLFANNKMGEFNILPIVGHNRLNEVYVVGQLYVDLFELSELPDIALSNRQGYRTDDLRYSTVIKYVSEVLLPEIVAKRTFYTSVKNKKKKEAELNRRRDEEDKLRFQVTGFKSKLSEGITESLRPSDENKKAYQEKIDNIVNSNMNILGLKSTVDRYKKKVLISHSSNDKDVADIIFSMLIHNGMEEQDILYTSSISQECRIPESSSIFDYLRDFFVNSFSDKKMFVIFVTSNVSTSTWSPTLEIGAEWITKMDSRIFNVSPCLPQAPMNNAIPWVNIIIHDEKPTVDALNADLFCQRIELICENVGGVHKEREENLRYLGTLLTIE